MAASNIYHLRISSAEKIGLIGNLSTLLSGGIPILDAVQSLSEDSTKGNMKKILNHLAESLMQGKHIYESLQSFPDAFDQVTINLLRAAEEAGTLETTLKDLRVHIQKEVEFIDKVKLAMVYPALIAMVFMGVLLVILLVVVPRISAVFNRLRVELPLPTKIMVGMSNIITEHTVYLGLGLASVFIGFFLLIRYQRKLVTSILFSLPLVSTLVRQIDVTRFSRSLHLLLASGIPITNALELTQKVVLRQDMSRIITKARTMVMEGKPLSASFRSEKGMIPSTIIRLIEAGEKSGSLDNSMQDIAEYYDYQVSNTLKTLVSVLEPVMLVVVGLLVGGLMLAIIAPIYGLIGNIDIR
jgi:type IV pilus assembly protein PilC